MVQLPLVREVDRRVGVDAGGQHAAERRAAARRADHRASTVPTAGTCAIRSSLTLAEVAKPRDGRHQPVPPPTATSMAQLLNFAPVGSGWR